MPGMAHANDTIGATGPAFAQALGDGWWWLLLPAAVVAVCALTFLYLGIAFLGLVVVWRIYRRAVMPRLHRFIGRGRRAVPSALATTTGVFVPAAAAQADTPVALAGAESLAQARITANSAGMITEPFPIRATPLDP
jgi:hypothetical protein